MRVIAYLRVSTDEQSMSGLGLEAQLHACAQYADRKGWEVASVHRDEGVSGATPPDRRPGLMAALGSLGRGDVLLVAKRDRLGRDMLALATIEATVGKRKARIYSAAGEGTEGDGDGDKLLQMMIDCFAVYERMVIKTRTRAALAAKSRRGERVGAVPYGYDLADDGKTLTRNESELAEIHWMRACRVGGETFRTIAALLDIGGVPTKQGKGRWTHQAVQRILSRPTSTGGEVDGRKVG